MKKITNRRNVLLLFSILVFTLLLSGCNGGIGSEDNLVWDTYSNNYLQFKYPGEWETVEIADYDEGIYTLVGGHASEIKSKSEEGDLTISNTDLLPFVVSSSVDMKQDPPTFEERKNDTQKYLQEQESKYSNYKIEKEVYETEVDGKRAIAFVLSGKVDPDGEHISNSNWIDYIKMKYIILPNYGEKTRNYIRLYTTEKKYEEHLEIFSEMVNSLEF